MSPGAAALALALAVAPPPAPDPPRVPPLREQHEVRQGWLKARLERVLPTLMRRHGVAMWIVVCREYNEDPVFHSLVSPNAFAARRRTILVTIGVNISHTHAFSDGLSAGEREQLETALGPWTSKIVRAENLPLDYISIRMPEMLPAYRTLMRIAHGLIARAFSNEVITPGKTTTADVEWWLRQNVNDQGLFEWFPPTVSVQRRGASPGSLLSERREVVIERGDHLHVDFGIFAMGLATDTQHVGYVLREGESDAPAGLRNALATSNRLQDLLMERMRPGRSGNEVLADTLAAMKGAGIRGTVYTHPIGDHGHGAGPLIGLWDRQQGVPGRGDVLLLPSTWFSIELEATSPVAEWGSQLARSAQEEDAVLDENGKISWVLERQTRYHLVR